jgi:Mn2+/Fe2+ NRAMP family transporter
MLYPPVPEQLSRLSIKNALSFLGPGAVLAAATIGSGELVFGSRNGAVFGYWLAWCFVWAGVFKGIQVYTATRYLTLTGEHPMMRWREIPGPRGWFPLLLGTMSILVMPVAYSVIPKILSTLTNHWFGLSKEDPHFAVMSKLAASAFLLVCFLFFILSSYSTLEKITLGLLLVMLFCISVAVVMTFRSPLGFLIGITLPQVPDYEPWVTKHYASFATRSPWEEVAVYLTAVGGGSYDYVGYVGMLREKCWGRSGFVSDAGRGENVLAQLEEKTDLAAAEVRRARLWLRAPLIDCALSFSFVVVISLLFVILGAEILHPRQLIPDSSQLLTVQESFLTLIHPSLKILYGAAVLLTFFGTLYGAFSVYTWTVFETARAVWPNATQLRLKSIQRYVLAYCVVGGLSLIWIDLEPVAVITLVAVLGGAPTCAAWCFAMLWTDSRFLPAPLRMGRGLKVMTIVAGVVMAVLGIKALAAYFS